MRRETRIYKKNFERPSGRGETVEIVKILIKSDQKNDLRGRHRFFGKSQDFWAARHLSDAHRKDLRILGIWVSQKSTEQPKTTSTSLFFDPCVLLLISSPTFFCTINEELHCQWRKHHLKLEQK
jgi:hypothetical protein